MIDARLSVNVLPSLYFQMFHLAMYMNNNHHLCISFMHNHVSEGIFATDAEDFITHVTHHVALPMQPQRRHVFIEMAIQLHLINFNRQVCYSA